MTASAHLDTFARDNLPRARNGRTSVRPAGAAISRAHECAVEVCSTAGGGGHGERPCLIAPGETLTYAQLAERVNRIANVLTRPRHGPGHRVLLRGPNSPMMVAAYLAVIKAGGVVVATMPLLRAKEIAYPIQKAKIKVALCDFRLDEEMEKRALVGGLERVVYWGGDGAEALETLMAKPGYERFAACDTASDDVCLIGFTSGTTGEPKGTMHFHRDMLATCDSYGRHVLRAEAQDRFIGSPPRLHLRARRPRPLSAAGRRRHHPDRGRARRSPRRHRQFRATIAFTAPTAYRAMLAKLATNDVSSLRKCVSAGEALPATFDAWLAATGIRILDGIGATEMLHIFIGSPRRGARRRNRPAGAGLRGARG